MAEVSEPSSAAAVELPAKDGVIAYLKAHPELLIEHAELMESLELAHASGSAVSLIERQVELLRGRNARLEARLEKLIEAARANERRADSVLRLARALIRAPSLAAIAVSFKSAMRENFDIDDVFIGINGSAYKRHDIDGVTPLEPNTPVVRAYDNFIRTRLIECGPLDEVRAKLLFPKSEAAIASAAVVPLEKEKYLGMIALGSRDAERFQPRQGKLFLEMVAELVAAAVRARLA
ncbi:MAG: hypothetical protein JWR16_3146 [Nevskia sp.]|nr:hypothetical protein [Nevskia sp.]